jgi:hypothetical protein
MSPFDFIKAITTTKQDLFSEDPSVKRDYKAYIINMGLSYFPDTVLYANEMNQRSHIDEDWQFYFLLNSISKKKRFSKWAKKESDSESISLIKEYYGYSSDKAKEALKLLTDDQLTMIKEKLYKGGK